MLIPYHPGILASELWLKFAAATGVIPLGDHFTPETVTNLIQAAFWEPRLWWLQILRADYQPLIGLSCANLPTTSLCNSDSPLCYVDTAIPYNKKGAHSVGLI